jgi:hypothetical protein
VTSLIDPDLFALTARLRRAQPRNADVIELCERAEKLVREHGTSLVANAVNEPSMANTATVIGANTAANKPKRHRAEYMRTYMRQRRAKAAQPT